MIICVADDLTQYWYHRLHHQIPWLWRFHRTHHSAQYMGVAMNNRQNAFYTIFLSQFYVTTTLVYLGLGGAAVTELTIKTVITNLSSFQRRVGQAVLQVQGAAPTGLGCSSGQSRPRQLIMLIMRQPAAMALATTRVISGTCSSCGTSFSVRHTFPASILGFMEYPTTSVTLGMRSSCGPFSNPTFLVVSWHSMVRWFEKITLEQPRLFQPGWEVHCPSLNRHFRRV